MSPNNNQPKYCYLDFDINNYRAQYATAAAFVHATDTRYGFTSKDIRKLGGSEISRINDLISIDHEWSSRATSPGIQTRPPSHSTRIIIQLHWDASPLACQNFSTLCRNNNNNDKNTKIPLGRCGKPLTYLNSRVHRIEPGFVVQMGDFVFGNGSGGESIWGKPFKDERGGLVAPLRHDRRGVVSMGNKGKHSNTSQFFVTLDEASRCDGKHVIFGKVVSGWDVLTALEKSVVANTTAATTGGAGAAGGGGGGGGDDNDAIIIPNVTIVDCGIYYCGDYEISPTIPAAGYWFDKPDDESYGGSVPVFVGKPRVAVLAPREARGRFERALGPTCVVVSCCFGGGGGGGETEEEGKEEAVIWRCLEEGGVDVIVVAPVWRETVAFLTSGVELPESGVWEGRKRRGLTVGDVVVVAKPVEALTAVRGTWIFRQDWIMDGV